MSMLQLRQIILPSDLCDINELGETLPIFLRELIEIAESKPRKILKIKVGILNILLFP